jgi:hypothetical protein
VSSPNQVAGSSGCGGECSDHGVSEGAGLAAESGTNTIARLLVPAVEELGEQAGDAVGLLGGESEGGQVGVELGGRHRLVDDRVAGSLGHYGSDLGHGQRTRAGQLVDTVAQLAGQALDCDVGKVVEIDERLRRLADRSRKTPAPTAAASPSSVKPWAKNAARTTTVGTPAAMTAHSERSDPSSPRPVNSTNRPTPASAVARATRPGWNRPPGSPREGGRDRPPPADDPQHREQARPPTWRARPRRSGAASYAPQRGPGGPPRRAARGRDGRSSRGHRSVRLWFQLAFERGWGRRRQAHRRDPGGRHRHRRVGVECGPHGESRFDISGVVTRIGAEPTEGDERAS